MSIGRTELPELPADVQATEIISKDKPWYFYLDSFCHFCGVHSALVFQAELAKHF